MIFLSSWYSKAFNWTLVINDIDYDFNFIFQIFIANQFSNYTSTQLRVAKNRPVNSYAFYCYSFAGRMLNHYE